MVIKTNPKGRDGKAENDLPELAVVQCVSVGWLVAKNKVLNLLKFNNFSYKIKIMSTTAIQRAINIAGSQKDLAALANLTQPAIHFLACGRNGRACFPRYQTAKKLSYAVGGVIAWHEFMEQGATQETPNCTEAAAAGSGDFVETTALKGGVATESSTSEPAQY